MEIGIKISDYKDAVKNITKANDRSAVNNNNFKISFDNSNSNMLSAYGEAISNLKASLQSFSEQMNSETDKLYAIGEEIEKLDKSLS